MAKSKIFSHTVYAPFQYVPKKRIKINGRKKPDYVGLENDFGPLSSKEPDRLKDGQEYFKPLEVIRKKDTKKKLLTPEEKKKLEETSYIGPCAETPSYLIPNVSGKTQLQRDKNLVK